MCSNTLFSLFFIFILLFPSYFCVDQFLSFSLFSFSWFPSVLHAVSSLHLLVSMPISVCQRSLLCLIFTSSLLSMLSYSQLLSHMSFGFYCFLSVPPVIALLLHLFLFGLHFIYLDILNFCLFLLFFPHQK